MEEYSSRLGLFWTKFWKFIYLGICQPQVSSTPMNKQNQPKTQFLNILEETSLHKDYELHTEHLLIMNEQEFEIPNYVNNDHAKI